MIELLALGAKRCGLVILSFDASLISKQPFDSIRGLRIIKKNSSFPTCEMTIVLE